MLSGLLSNSGGRPRRLLLLLLAVFGIVLITAPVRAQTPVPPTVERTVVKIDRGSDIVQPPTVVHKQVRDGEDPARVSGDTVGVMKVPRDGELDAIRFLDTRTGTPVNLQHAMIVRGGRIADVEISRESMGWPVPPGARSVTRELLVLRPPQKDAFDVAIPRELDCVRLAPESEEARVFEGRLYENAPCKQVPGVETVIDLRAWVDAATQSDHTGPRPSDRPFSNAIQLRGKLKSTAPGGERVRFSVVATPPPRVVIAARAPTRLDTVIQDPVIETSPEPVRIQTVAVPDVEWMSRVAALGGPTRSRLPAAATPREYRARRYKGDVRTTLRWSASPEHHYELTAFGSTQVSRSDQQMGNHHAVPYGGSIAARFGKAGSTGILLQAEGAYTDDPFQMTTLSEGDQRLRLLAGVDVSSTLHQPLDWHLAVGPTYFVDRPSAFETRDDARELGYSIDAELHRSIRFLQIPAAFTVRSQVVQTWGYVQDSDNTNLALTGRVSAKPYLRLGRSTAAIGPVVYANYTRSEYANAPAVDQQNLQVGIEITSHIRF